MQVPQSVINDVRLMSASIPHTTWSEFERTELTESQLKDLAFLYVRVKASYERGEYHQSIFNLLNNFSYD